jgi:hypothetical protein
MDVLDKLEVQELLSETIEFMGDPQLKEEAVKTAGWTKKSVAKFGESIGKAPDEKGFFDACVLKMGSKVDDPKGLCASLKDTYFGNTNWRGNDEKK